MSTIIARLAGKFVNLLAVILLNKDRHIGNVGRLPLHKLPAGFQTRGIFGKAQVDLRSHFIPESKLGRRPGNDAQKSGTTQTKTAQMVLVTICKLVGRRCVITGRMTTTRNMGVG